MTDRGLPAHPSFHLRLAAKNGDLHDVLGPDGAVIGQVSATSSSYCGWVGRDAGPSRHTAAAAACDAVTFHIAVHGVPADEQQPYASCAEARDALALVPLQREEIVNSSARAYYFHALRQPQVAAILDGLEAVSREVSAVGTRAGCRRIARLLHQVLSPARVLLAEAEGEAREWMAFPVAQLAALAEQSRTRLLATTEQPPAGLRGPFPSAHAADQVVDAVRRTWRDLEHAASTASTLALPLERLRAAVDELPNGPCARNHTACRTTTAALHAVATEADATGMAVVSDGLRPRVRELAALATDGAERLEATTRLLEDTARLGKVTEITRDLDRAQLGPEDNAGRRSVRIERHEVGPITQTPVGDWTGPGITTPTTPPRAPPRWYAHTSPGRPHSVPQPAAP
ncbi:hypothetical protein [Streptomyces noursei]|uniref:hypothetical protein n=1 Tax=Streptomyces noursei TaxID=1971 RepID=UPI001678F71E|nr:hypothetical protein [Streptomyces noursei]MCZ1021422.1 hypothetical protein [Streptomyces noursei]GGX46353.1 hypothetical protein GCM10010341_80090 [Streptomyces noursei]